MLKKNNFDYPLYYRAKEELHDDWWEKHLKPQGVIYPTKNTCMETGLVYLFIHLGECVDKNKLADYVRLKHSDVSYDQQSRHLRAKGWDVRGGGGRSDFNTKNHLPSGERMPKSTYGLFSVTEPHPNFDPKILEVRTGELSKQEWDFLLSRFNNKCACCGKNCDNYDKAHMDPRKPVSIDNIIPLCLHCNNRAFNNVVFNQYGQIIEILNGRVFSDGIIVNGRFVEIN